MNDPLAAQARDALGVELERMLPILVDAVAALHEHGRRRYRHSPEFRALIRRAEDSAGRASDMLALYGVAKFPFDPITRPSRR